MTPSEMAKIDAYLDRDNLYIDMSDEAALADWAEKFSRILDREVLEEEVWEWFDSSADEDDDDWAV